MYDSIVIAVDGSAAARHAARRGIEFARAFDATVSVVHVRERKTLDVLRGSDERERLGDPLAEITALAEALDAEEPVETRETEGRPVVQITAYADERDANLVVVGRGEMGGAGEQLLGSTTDRLLRRSDVPVFVVPDGDDSVDGADGADGSDGADGADGSDGATAEGYDRILLPTDGSEASDGATPHGIAVAREFDATIHVLNVVDVQAAGGLFDAGGLEAAVLDRLTEQGQEAVDAVEDDITDIAPAIPVETAVERTSSQEGVAVGIREYVTDAGIDLIVLRSHGRSNLERHLVGSVASRLLRTVSIPVLVVTRPS